MNIKAISALLEVVSTGSISAAAQKMERSRTLVSNWIADMESEWQTELLDRSAKRPILTHAGQQLLPYLEELIRDAQQIEKVIDTLKQQHLNNLSVGFDYLLPSAFKSSIVAHICAQNDDLELQVKELPGHELLGQVESGRLDLAFSDVNLVCLKRMTARSLGYYQFVLCCSASHPLAELEQVTDYELQSYRKLLITGTKERFRAKNAIEVTNYQTMVELTRAGVGYCLCPLIDIKEALDNKELVILNTNLAVNRVQVTCFWPRTSIRVGRMEKLFGQLKDVESGDISIPGLLSYSSLS